MINFLWIGDYLNKMCQLTLKSFLDFDHQVILWAYNKEIKNIPSGVIVKNANEILEKNNIFSYKGFGDCRNGSYGGFSDIFRYHLLDKIGGWYCDMDVTCMNNFSTITEKEYCIKPHNKYHSVANVIKAPKDSFFIKKCIEDTENQVNEKNDQWVLPLKILSDNVKDFKLDEFIVPKDYFGNDDVNDLHLLLKFPFLKDQYPLPKYAIHWCNEAISTGQWDKKIKRCWDSPLPTTLYYRLLKKHKII